MCYKPKFTPWLGMLVLAAATMGVATASAQTDNAPPRVFIDGFSIFRAVYNYSLEEPFFPGFGCSDEMAAELDYVVIHTTIIDPDWLPPDPNNQQQNSDTVYLAFLAVPILTGYPPDAPPIVETDPNFDITISAGTPAGVPVDLGFYIPQFSEASQLRLRGCNATGIPFDVAWYMVIGAANSQCAPLTSLTAQPTQDCIYTINFGEVGAIKNGLTQDPPPQAFANAGSDQTVVKNTTVTLDASRTFASYNIGFDPNNPNVILKNPIAFTWDWISGPVKVVPDQTSQTSPLATVILPQAGTYVYRVTADNLASSDLPTQDSVTITVLDSLPVNNPPTAVIVGPANAIPIGAIIKLDGSQSFDPENGSLTYRWRQTNEIGGEVDPNDLGKVFQPLSGVDQAVTTWQAVAAGTFYFRLNVDDGTYLSTTRFTITVFDPNTLSAAHATASDLGGSTLPTTGNQSTTTDSGDGATKTGLSGFALCGSGLTFALGPSMLVLLTLRRRRF